MKFVQGTFAVLAAVALLSNVAVATETKDLKKVEKAFCEKEMKHVVAKDKAACEKMGGMWKDPAAAAAAAVAPAAAPAPAHAPEQHAQPKK